MKRITVYGKEGCIDTATVRDALGSIDAPYEWIDVTDRRDLETAAMSMNGGVSRWPTVIVSDAYTVLTEPSIDELQVAVGSSIQMTVTSDNQCALRKEENQ